MKFPYLKVITLIILFFILLSVQNPIFYKERVELLIKKDNCRLTGMYYFKNNGTLPVDKMIYYPISEIVLQITDIKDMDHEPIPLGITLEQNFPNPFNNSTTFFYSLERKEYIDISIYDLQGRLVDQLYSGY